MVQVTRSDCSKGNTVVLTTDVFLYKDSVFRLRARNTKSSKSNVKINDHEESIEHLITIENLKNPKFRTLTFEDLKTHIYSAHKYFATLTSGYQITKR